LLKQALGYNEDRRGDSVKDASFRVFLFILGLLGMIWPLIEVFRLSVVPYVFSFWFVLIVLALLSDRLCAREGPATEKKRPPV
jgi:hypothetical protein